MTLDVKRFKNHSALNKSKVVSDKNNAIKNGYSSHAAKNVISKLLSENGSKDNKRYRRNDKGNIQV